MIMVALITISALIIKLSDSNTTLLIIINGTLILLILWMLTEGVIYFLKNKHNG